MHITASDPIAQEVKTILLNGVDVTSLVVELDTDEGWVKMLVMGVDGRALVDNTGAFLTLQVHGRVVVGMKGYYPCTFCLSVFDSPGVWARHIKSHQFVPN